ncbi:MAG TPA: sigma-70 family RNA polymerase sigma factor [Candidatus Eisenbacteria bacterium]|nr:sigma-70 family RNA polymerase sigma factor [Candidatus Eisenbacteria bacterium]
MKRLVGANGRAPRELVLTREEERRLLRDAREGDAVALRRLLERVSPPIYRFGRGFCGDTEDAKDVMQEVLVSLVRSLPSIRGDSSITTWAYTVARRACARQRRRSRDREMREPESGLEHVAAPEDRTSDPSREAERREVETAVRDAILLLPPPQREAIVLRDLEGVSAREAARILRVSERALKSRLHRARLALRDALAGSLGETPPAGIPGSCPDAGRLLSRYLEGELNARTCASMESHLRTCRSCGRACRALKRSLTLCRRYGSRPLSTAARKSLRGAIRGAIAESRSAPRSSRSSRSSRS